MGLYQHPHLTRGVVHTSMGAFTVNRGVVDLPDSLGESLGWTPVTPGDDWHAPAERHRERQRSDDRRAPIAHPPAAR